MKPIKNKHICMKCLKEKKGVKQHVLNPRGFGSSFDGFGSKFQLCDECKPENLEEWLNESATFSNINTGIENYSLEEALLELVTSFPPEGRELFWNKYSYGFNADKMDRADALAIEAGAADDDVYRKYYMYTPREIHASKKLFPTCAYVYGVKYNDDSIGYRCMFHHDAYGNLGDNSHYNVYCAKCTKYKRLDGTDRPIIPVDKLKKQKEKIKEESDAKLRIWIENQNKNK